MASNEFTSDIDIESMKSNIQKGDPFLEKLLLEACNEITENKLVEGMQDMGAGGLLCSSLELVQRGREKTKKNLEGKTALITGITGQDGAYLAELLLKKGYIVHGIKRRSSSFNTGRVDHLYEDPHIDNRIFILHYGDLTDSTNLIRIIKETQPNELYNLAAQSHVKVSFETPEYTANSDALGTLRLLEAIRILGLEKKPLHQASTSEMYGLVQVNAAE